MTATTKAELDRLYVEHVAEVERGVTAVLAAQGLDALVVHSGAPAPRSRFDDQSWPLRVCPHFQHWIALPEPDCLIVAAPGRRPRLLRPTRRNFWEGPAAPESDAFLSIFEECALDDLSKARALAPSGRLAFVGEDPARAALFGFDPEGANPAAVVQALDALRTLKTPYEVACLAEANRRARLGHDALRAAFGAGDACELDLHLEYLRATRQDDSDTPYKNIVALGEHAATLHHVAYAKRTAKRPAESLLVDAGAGCRGYGSDVTRTWVKGRGAAASTFAALVSGVDAMQQRLASGLRAGIRFEVWHDESHRQVADVLRETGIGRGSAEELVTSGLTRAFYPHGLGHSLGLQTHDVGCGLHAPRPDNAFLRNTSETTAGQVVTIEPGVYFIESLLAAARGDPRLRGLVDWTLVDALAPLGGVRIEDDVVVLAAGVRNLTREHLPEGGGAVD